MEQKLITNVQINYKTYSGYYSDYLMTYKTPYKRYLLFVNEFFLNNFFLSYKMNIFKFFFFFNFNLCDFVAKNIYISSLVIKDLINLNTIWRLIKGYGTKGQRTHSNNKNIKKNKLLHTYRLEQFFLRFGYRKRNIYPTLIIGEYTNKLWKLNWFVEWCEAYLYLLKLIKPNTRKIPFDPVKLSKNFTNGYTRVGTASKIGKSKKITKVCTIGLPIFFSKWLYYDIPPRSFPYILWISDSDRKKMGVKRKKNKKK